MAKKKSSGGDKPDPKNKKASGENISAAEKVEKTAGFSSSSPSSSSEEEFQKETDSRIFQQLQGAPQSPEEERIATVKQRTLLVESWHFRDDLYRELFGEPAYAVPDTYAPPPLLAEEDVVLSDSREPKGETGDPGHPGLDEQHLNVLAYPPDPTRHYWTYVTAGLSSPWLQDSPAEVSGFGCELMIKTKEDRPWAVQILRTMAFYILNHAGTLSPGVRIDLNGPIAVNTDSKLTNVFIWYPDEAPDCWYYLPSGGFGLFLAVGMTPEERKFAESIQEYGTWCIQQVLRQTGEGQITDPTRDTVMNHEDIGNIMMRVKIYADTFRENIAEPGQIVEG